MAPPIRRSPGIRVTQKMDLLKVRHIIRKNWHILSSDEKLKEVFQHPPMFAFKKSRSIKNRLIRASNHLMTSETSRTGGTAKPYEDYPPEKIPEQMNDENELHCFIIVLNVEVSLFGLHKYGCPSDFRWSVLATIHRERTGGGDIFILYGNLDEVPQPFAATNDEITSIAEQLYSADVNKAVSGDITVNLQYLASSTQTGSGNDYASQKLFSYVNEAKLFARPTFARYISLLDNYVKTSGTAESVPTGEVSEQNAFIDEVFKTSIFSILSNFLISKGYYTSATSFKEDLKLMWFGLYTRTKGPLDSSGFEHIFLGEIHGGKVSGFHSWVQFYLQEKSGQINYLSYSANGPWTGYPDVLGVQFKWSTYLKSIGSMFVGSSPEFDLAMFTLCYVTRPDSVCTVRMGGQTLKIQTYTWANSSYGSGKRYVASSYPVV
ncbi:uridylate-specific endoribonuclease C-like [Gastrophryne carolinensis]